MSILSSLRSKVKSVTGRKFLSPKGTSCIYWSVDGDGDARFCISDERHSVVFSDWLSDQEDKVSIDKKMGIIADEIAAFRKAIKAKK
jgi:hypothetical protein